MEVDTIIETVQKGLLDGDTEGQGISPKFSAVLLVLQTTFQQQLLEKYLLGGSGGMLPPRKNRAL